MFYFKSNDTILAIVGFGLGISSPRRVLTLSLFYKFGITLFDWRNRQGIVH